MLTLLLAAAGSMRLGSERKEGLVEPDISWTADVGTVESGEGAGVRCLLCALFADAC